MTAVKKEKMKQLSAEKYEKYKQKNYTEKTKNKTGSNQIVKRDFWFLISIEFAE